MMPSVRHARERSPGRCRRFLAPLRHEQRRCAFIFVRAPKSSGTSPRDCRVPPRAGNAADLHAKDLGPRRRARRIPRSPRNGLPSSTVKPGTGLSPPASMVRIVTGLPRGPFEHACGSARYCVSSSGSSLAEQELRAHQPDAVAGSRCRCGRASAGSATLTSTAHRHAVRGRRRASSHGVLGAAATLAICRGRSAESLYVACCRPEHDAAMLGVEQGDTGDVLGGVPQARPPSARRASAPASPHGSPRLPLDSAMPPPADQSVARKRVGAMSSPNRIAPGGAIISPSRGQDIEHLLANVLEVGGARRKYSSSAAS